MERVYYAQPYLTEATCKITGLESKGAQHLVELDRTIFFPEGGGQPSDQGELVGSAGSFKVDQVRTVRDSIVHQGILVGTLNIGDAVTAKLRWSARYKNMRVHSAGHVVHDVLMSMTDSLIPTSGNHGPKAYLEYRGALDPAIKDKLQAAVNQAVQNDLPIITGDIEYDELVKRCQFVPPRLPTGKTLRVIEIGCFAPMPDGGVHVKSTREIGAVVIHSISTGDNVVTIRYGVAGPPSSR